MSTEIPFRSREHKIKEGPGSRDGWPGLLVITLFICVLFAFPFSLLPSALAEDPALEDGSLQARGLVRARYRTVLSSEIAGRITRIPFREGDVFEAGAVLLQLDESLLQAELAKSAATLKAAEKKLAFHRELETLKSIGAMEVALDEALVEERQAEHRIANLALSRCTIRAPYGGTVVQVLASEHQSIKPQQELLEILSDKDLEIEVLVPSKWLGWVRKGLSFSVIVDETGHTGSASVAAVGGAVDPVSKMVPLRGRFTAPSQGLVPGMGVTAVFRRP